MTGVRDRVLGCDRDREGDFGDAAVIRRAGDVTEVLTVTVTVTVPVPVTVTVTSSVAWRRFDGVEADALLLFHALASQACPRSRPGLRAGHVRSGCVQGRPGAARTPAGSFGLTADSRPTVRRRG